MHVRGSSLSQPRVLEALKPYIVAFWGQANDEPIPADVRPLYEASGYGSSNVRCFVLDPEGKLVHSFNGFPANAGDPTAFSKEQYAAYFAGEIIRGSARLTPPSVSTTPAALKLPEPKDGVRLFIRLPNRPDSYGYPVVETVENREEWQTLAYPKTARDLEASRLSRWLSLCYPPGVNEQLEPFQVVRGTLKLQPAGPRQAILSGKIRLANTETGYELVEGTLEAVLDYPDKPEAETRPQLRGAVEGIFWRWEPRRNRWMDWRLTMAIESSSQQSTSMVNPPGASK